MNLIRHCNKVQEDEDLECKPLFAGDEHGNSKHGYSSKIDYQETKHCFSFVCTHVIYQGFVLDKLLLFDASGFFYLSLSRQCYLSEILRDFFKLLFVLTFLSFPCLHDSVKSFCTLQQSFLNL